GGFDGSESSPADRNPSTPKTILSADVLGDDDGLDNRSDNVTRLFDIHAPLGTVSLNGLTLTGGNGFDARGSGGAIWCEDARLSLTDMTVLNHHAVDGGALGALNCSLNLDTVSFVHNQALLGGSGGAIYARGGSLVADRVFLLGNRAVSYGGGVFVSYGTQFVSTNGVSIGNQAYVGGALAFWSIDDTIITHLSATENQAQSQADTIYGFGSTAAISNSIVIDPNRDSTFLASNATLTSSCVGNIAGVVLDATVLPTCTTIFTSTPSAGDDGEWGTSDDVFGDLTPVPAQPGENAGSTPITIEQGITLDASGNSRVCGEAVDMGAYEITTGCN
ncbi:MAG: hypothetical protein VX834_04000, partial [Myxococcota bacterium]|nr:hypothetical protein [Myxococcota bacterium]